MPIPTHIVFARPVLEVLAENPTGLRRSDIYERMATWAGLTEDERAHTITSGQETYKSRVGWACTWLKLAGLVNNPSRGTWSITEAGKKRLKKNPTPFTHQELSPKRPHESDGGDDDHDDGDSANVIAPPEERIDAAIKEIHRALMADLLSRLRAGSPAFFEKTVLKLLSAMGYGRFEHRGKTGDHGIDGVMHLDLFGLERVYVQAKRYADASVGPEMVRAFSGAMDEHDATKGVFVTASRFTEQTKSYRPRGGKVIQLVDGEHLARLMLERGVGVSTSRTIEVKAIDEDFFDE